MYWRGDCKIIENEVLGGFAPKENKLKQAEQLLKSLYGLQITMISKIAVVQLNAFEDL